jgi:hypothetical protein
MKCFFGFHDWGPIKYTKYREHDHYVLGWFIETRNIPSTKMVKVCKRCGCINVKKHIGVTPNEMNL